MTNINLSYYWTESAQNSAKLATEINNGPFSQVISTINVDNTNLRNMLLYGKHPQAMVPFFTVQEGDKIFSYPPSESRKVFNLAERILKQQESQSEDLSSSEITIDGFYAASSGKNVSRIYENSNIPSILN